MVDDSDEEVGNDLPSGLGDEPLVARAYGYERLVQAIHPVVSRTKLCQSRVVQGTQQGHRPFHVEIKKGEGDTLPIVRVRCGGSELYGSMRIFAGEQPTHHSASRIRDSDMMNGEKVDMGHPGGFFQVNVSAADCAISCGNGLPDTQLVSAVASDCAALAQAVRSTFVLDRYICLNEWHVRCREWCWGVEIDIVITGVDGDLLPLALLCTSHLLLVPGPRDGGSEPRSCNVIPRCFPHIPYHLMTDRQQNRLASAEEKGTVDVIDAVRQPILVKPVIPMAVAALVHADGHLVVDPDLAEFHAEPTSRVVFIHQLMLEQDAVSTVEMTGCRFMSGLTQAHTGLYGDTLGGHVAVDGTSAAITAAMCAADAPSAETLMKAAEHVDPIFEQLWTTQTIDYVEPSDQ